MKKKITLIGIIFFTMQVFAQTDTLNMNVLWDMSLEELMQLEVVTASKFSQKATEAPATILVVTEEQIKERGYQSLLDVFYDLPDIKVDYSVDPRWMNDITIRGIRGMDKFIILLDGVKISSPTNDVVAVMENYPVHFAKQIEIVYGPASALYGADAFSGVINIISKETEKKNTFDLLTSYGMYNTVNTNFYYNHKFTSDFNITLTGQYFYDKQPALNEYFKEEYEGMLEELESGTFNTIFGTITPKAPMDNKKENPLYAYNYLLGINYKKFKINYFSNHAQIPSTTVSSPHNAVYNNESKFGCFINMANISYQNNFKKINSTTTLTVSRYDLDNKSNFRNVWTNMEPAYLYAYGSMFKIDELISYPVLDNLNISAGVTYEHFTSMPRTNNLQDPISEDNSSGKDINFNLFGNQYGLFISDGALPNGTIVNSIFANNPDGIPANLIKTTYNNIGGLLQLQYNPLNNMFLTIGGRVDNDDRFGLTINPRLGLVYEPINKLNVKLLYGSAFLAPSPQSTYDRYGTFNSNDNGLTYYSFFFQMPNENVKPQKVNTYELGINSYLNDNLNISFSGYFSNVKGLISPISDSSKIADLYYDENVNGFAYEGYPVFSMQISDNLGTSQIFGGSIQFNYYKTFSKNTKLNLYLVYSYIDGFIDIDEAGPLPNRNLPGVSPHSLHFGSTFNYKNLSISPRIIAFGEQRTFNTASVQIDDNTKYQVIDGFVLFNMTFVYRTKFANFTLKGINILDQRYYNVNIGAAPENEGAGSAAAELSGGAPQNPIRIVGGVQILFGK